MEEVWKEIFVCPSYFINNFGDIRSNKTNRILKLSIDKNGFYMVRTSDRKSLYPHRLVAENFINNLENRRFVIHIDGNKLNNHYSNLKWSGSVIKDEEIIRVLPGEEWKKLDGCTNIYEVSNLGRVYSNLSERIIIPDVDPNGYHSVSLKVLCNPSKFIKKRIHRLVAQTFIPNLENKPFINHINAIRNDNRVENLEWCTQKENLAHARKIGNMDNTREKIALNIINEITDKESMVLVSDLKIYLKELINSRKLINV